MITYKHQGPASVTVILDGRTIGEIRRSTEGWAYYPNGSKGRGEFFPSLLECKKSLGPE